MQMLAATFDMIERQRMSLDAFAAQSAEPAALKQQIDAVANRAMTIAFDDQSPTSARTAGLRLLGRAGGGMEAELERIGNLISPQSSPELQRTAVMHLATRSEPTIAPLLLAQLGPACASIRSQILDALLRRATWSAALLDAVERQSVAAADLDAVTRARLSSLDDAALRQRAGKLLASSLNTDRQRVVAEYQPHLKLKGDRARGATLFATKCASCHRVGEVGREVGPNLAALTDKSPTALLTAMLDPNQAVETRYLSYLAETTDGRLLSGVLASETATGITLVGANGDPQSLLRSDIETLKASGKSLMPEGFEKELAPQDVVDLIEFLQ